MTAPPRHYNAGSTGPPRRSTDYRVVLKERTEGRGKSREEEKNKEKEIKKREEKREKIDERN